jgi:outer membrane protein OmpA-like peptidoglycan-associated protein
VDLFGGIRYFYSHWFYFGAGYRHFINSTDTNTASGVTSDDHHGYTVIMSFQRRKNAVPTLECDVDKTTILEGDRVQLTARANDIDYDSTLTYKWTATGGRIEGSDQSATWHSEQSKPGTYTITVSVTDNRGATVSCSKDVTVNKRNLAPTVDCQPKAISIMVGETARIRAIASDPNNDRLTYEWTIAGERVATTGEELVFGSAGRRPGEYAVNVRVSDGEFAATCTVTVTVTAQPNKLPTVSCSVDRTEVMAGERVNVTASGSDPDNDPLTYQWSVTGGRIEGTGAQATLDTTGLSAGTYVITVRVSDGKGGTANSTCSVHVRERIRILMDKVRVDNVAKATLDDMALKLQRDPRIQATITGYTDNTGNARTQERGGMQRAEEVKKYLVDKHKIDPNRLTVRSGGSSDPVAPNDTAEGRKQNRRAEIELYIP